MITPARIVAAAVAALLIACGGSQSLPCQEDDERAVELPRVPLSVRTVEVSAELADDDAERRDAWVGRVCELDALLWVMDEVEPPAVTLCGVEVAVDLAMVRDGEVIAVELDREPCDDPCEECPAHGIDGPAAQAVLWTLAGAVDVQVGDAISGLEAVSLPAPP